MSHIPPIRENRIRELSRLQSEIGKLGWKANCSAGAAAFLFIGALIVIGSGCLCLTLPGVNVIRDVIVKAVFPGSIALILTIPLIVRCTLDSRSKSSLREDLIIEMVEITQENHVENLPKDDTHKDQEDFLLIHFLNWQKKTPTDRTSKWCRNVLWDKEYQRQLLADVKEKLEKRYQAMGGITAPQNRLLESFEDARNTINNRKA